MFKPYIAILLKFAISGNLQNGRISDEDARRRKHAREEDGQNFPSDGQEQGWKIESGRIYRGSQERSFHRALASMRSQILPVTCPYTFTPCCCDLT